MSHVVTIPSKIRDATAIASACQRLKLAAPVQGTASLYSSEAKGIIVRLPGWEFPIVIDTASGNIAYDNYNGAWGDQAELSKFLQSYAVEVVRLEARKKGFGVTETTLADGSVRLQVQEGY